jgi:sulfur carrier protein
MEKTTVADATFTVNGELQPYREQTVYELLQSFGFEPDKPGIAIALNAEVIPRRQWSEVRPQPGDQIEIVRAVAGG